MCVCSVLVVYVLYIVYVACVCVVYWLCVVYCICSARARVCVCVCSVCVCMLYTRWAAGVLCMHMNVESKREPCCHPSSLHHLDFQTTVYLHV